MFSGKIYLQHDNARQHVSEIVKKTAMEFNIPYDSNRTFFSALKAHGKMLRMLGQKDCPDFVHI